MVLSYIRFSMLSPPMRKPLIFLLLFAAVQSLHSQSLSGAKGNFTFRDTLGRVLLQSDADTVFISGENKFAFPLKGTKVGLSNLVTGKTVVPVVYDKIYLKQITYNFNDEAFVLDGDVKVFLSPDSALLCKEIFEPGGMRVLQFCPLRDSAYEYLDTKFRIGVQVVAGKNVVLENSSKSIDWNMDYRIVNHAKIFRLDRLQQLVDTGYSFVYMPPYFIKEQALALNLDYTFGTTSLVSKDPFAGFKDSLQTMLNSTQLIAAFGAANNFTWRLANDTAGMHAPYLFSIQRGTASGTLVLMSNYPYAAQLFGKNSIMWGGNSTAQYDFVKGEWMLSIFDYEMGPMPLRAGTELVGFNLYYGVENEATFILYYENGSRLAYDSYNLWFNPYGYPGNMQGRTYFGGYRWGDKLIVNDAQRQETEWYPVEDPYGGPVIYVSGGENCYVGSGIYDYRKKKWDIEPVQVYAGFDGRNEIFSSRREVVVDTALDFGTIAVPVWRYSANVRDTATGKIRPAGKQDAEITSKDFYKGRTLSYPQGFHHLPDSVWKIKHGLVGTYNKTRLVNADTLWPNDDFWYMERLYFTLPDGRVVAYDFQVLLEYGSLYRGNVKINTGAYSVEEIRSSRFLEVADTAGYQENVYQPELYDLRTGLVILRDVEYGHFFANDSSFIAREGNHSDSAASQWYVVHGAEIYGPFDRFDSTVYCVRAYSGKNVVTFDYEGNRLFGNDTAVVKDYGRIAGLILVKSAAGYNLYSTLTSRYLFAAWQDQIDVYLQPLRANQPVILATKAGKQGMLDYFTTLSKHTTTWEVPQAKKQVISFNEQTGVLKIQAKKKVVEKRYFGILTNK
jgi:hypothetical protein